MNQDRVNIIELCVKVCDEFNQHGFKMDTDPRTLKESYNIQKQPNGQWFKLTKKSLHDTANLALLDFSQMPALLELTNLIDKTDSEINKKGGRVYITHCLVYKIKRGSETPLFFEIKQACDSNDKFSKLCEEIRKQELNPDRYRVQETYLLTRAANGEWSVISGHENHSTTKIVLNLKTMPLLKALVLKLTKLDPQLQANGGRIFVSPSRVYRIKNKIELDYRL